MTLAERSVYRDLLDCIYEKGSLPKDRRLLAQLAGATELEFNEVWPNVSKNFKPCHDDPTRLTNPVAEEEILRRAEKVRAGKKGGRPPCPKPDGFDDGKPDGLQTENHTQNESENNLDIDSPGRSADAEATPANYPHLTSVMKDLIRRTPSSVTVESVMAASNGASEDEVIKVITTAVRRSKVAPANFRWCEVVVHEHYHRGEMLRPAAPAVKVRHFEDFDAYTAAIDTTDADGALPDT